MIPRRSIFEVRCQVSVMLPQEGLAQPQDMRYGPLRCEKFSNWGDLAHLEFVGEYKAWKRWAVAAKAMQHLHNLIEDGTEVIFYIEEKSWNR